MKFVLHFLRPSLCRFDHHARLFAGVACLLFTGRFGGVDAYEDTTRTQRVCLICKKQWTVDASEPAPVGDVKVCAILIFVFANLTSCGTHYSVCLCFHLLGIAFFSPTVPLVRRE